MDAQTRQTCWLTFQRKSAPPLLPTVQVLWQHLPVLQVSQSGLCGFSWCQSVNPSFFTDTDTYRKFTTGSQHRVSSLKMKTALPGAGGQGGGKKCHEEKNVCLSWLEFSGSTDVLVESWYSVSSELCDKSQFRPCFFWEIFVYLVCNVAPIIKERYSAWTSWGGVGGSAIDIRIELLFLRKKV